MAGGWGTANSCTASTTSFTLTDTAATVTYYACKSTCSYTNSTAATPSTNVCAGTCNTGYSTSGGSNAGTAASCSGTTCTCSARYYTITLDKNGGTADGTTTIYTTYATNVYNDSARSKGMTTSANPIATAPSKTYTVTYNGNSGTVGTTSSANTTSSAPFNGFYSATSSGTQYITSSKYITSNGLTAGKAEMC